MKNKIYILDLPSITKKAALSEVKNTHPYDDQNYIKLKDSWTCSPKVWINWLKKNYSGEDYIKVIADVEQEMFPYIFGEENS